MAKIIFKGVPDFTEVRAEIAKLKQEVASVSSTKVNLNGTAQGLNGAANAAGKLAGNLQKISTNPTAIHLRNSRISWVWHICLSPTTCWWFIIFPTELL